jgi:NAD(P)-dependent dehydrogenase (short-subunit alcohol dehydrogenase family)
MNKKPIKDIDFNKNQKSVVDDVIYSPRSNLKSTQIQHKSNLIEQKKSKNLNAALITGSAKRIGREIALNLAALGYDILISYNNSKTEAQKLAKKIIQDFGVKCEIFQCNLQDVEQTKKLAEFSIKKFPHLNLLVNNASIFNKSKFLTAPDCEMMENLNTHLISPLILSKTFAQNVQKNSVQNAQIINLIDKNIVRYDTSYFYYLLSKKALGELTKMLALELAPQVRVNGIAPGFILNPIDEKTPSPETQNIIKKIPLKTKGDPKNIWQAVEFLLKNNFVNGQILFIDGGASLNHAG